MASRLNRTEQSTLNRERILSAARRVFLARGYHGATLEQIAEEAGFTKGAVYSRFEGKADLFLALLDARIDERARENAALADGLPADRATARLLEHFTQVNRGEPEWPLLVIEFRVHAARDPELNRRYAALHERTLEALEELFTAVFERSGEEPPRPARRLAELVMAIGAGTDLELAADPEALGGELLPDVLLDVLTPNPAAARARSAA